MNAHVKTIVVECTEGSDAGTLTFPQVVGRLMEAGVESYYADLRRATKIYYMPDGESHVVNAAKPDGKPAHGFSADGVVAALREVQSRKIDYHMFCEKILAAGCVAYIVSIAGRRAVYFGRTGETYVEMFPSAK
jgi:uncharacterized protein YbcV (DUF1398 family)